MFKKEETKTDTTSNRTNSRNSALEILMGIILLGVGLYILSTRVIVHNSWYIWRFGNFDISSGAVTIPLMLGIIWLVINPKSIGAKILTILSAIFIVVSIILSVRLNFVPTPLFVYILIFGLISVGSGLLLRNGFNKK